MLLTMTGEQGVRALQIVRPRVAVPIHTDDYTVFRSGIDDFRRAVAAAGPSLRTDVRDVERGETWRFDLPVR